MAENKKKKSKFSLRKLVYNDKYLIIISIILAVVVWIVTTMNLSPETSKTIAVPVAVDFKGSVAEQLGLKCYGEESFEVNVTVSCKKYLAKDITAEDIAVTLEKNTVTASGYTDVPVKVDANDNADFQIISYYPNSYRAFFDFVDEKTMDIDVEFATEDFVEQGYIMGELLLSESTATVTGPRTFVSQVDKVVARVNVKEKLKATMSTDLNITAVDSYGSNVSYVNTVSSSGDAFTLTIPVLKVTNLDVQAAFTGKPSKVNTNDFGISYSVSKVNAGVLDENTSAASIGSIDFSQLKAGANSFSFDVKDINGLVVLDDIDTINVTVNVPSTYTSTTIPVTTANAEVINVPSGYKATVTGINSKTVTAIGQAAALKPLNTSNVKLVVDMSEVKEADLKTGISPYVVTATLENSDNCWIYGEYKAYVNITKA